MEPDECSPSPTLLAPLLAKRSTSPHSSGMPGAIDAVGLERLLLRQRICNMFRRYLPAKMHRLPEALERCRGREESLLSSLVAKMGAEPPFTPQQQRLADIVLERVLHDGADQREEGCEDFSQTILSSTGRSPRRESFASAVAQTAALHTMKGRLLEMYTSKRTQIASDETLERDALVRTMMTETRARMIQSFRQQQDAVMQKREQERRAAEAEWVTRRQQQVLHARLERLLSDELQKFILVASEVQNEERTARRVQYQVFLDDASAILREDKHRERERQKHNAEIDRAHQLAERRARAEEVRERIEARRRRQGEELEKSELTRKESSVRMEQYVLKMRNKYRLIEEERKAEAARVLEETTRRRSTGRGFIGFGTKTSSMLGTTLSETLGTTSSCQLDEDVNDELESANDWSEERELPPLRTAPRAAELLPALHTMDSD